MIVFWLSMFSFHCIGGGVGRRSNCGRIRKGETVSDWFLGYPCSVFIA